jgi:predicted RNA binding protein YcfA (HicA-like mRNA interferase family)
VPRLSLSFREFIRIIEANGFTFHDQGATSHRRYRGVVEGKVQIVVVAYHSLSDDIKPGTLDSMIRQTGLPKKLFRK